MSVPPSAIGRSAFGGLRNQVTQTFNRSANSAGCQSDRLSQIFVAVAIELTDMLNLPQVELAFCKRLLEHVAGNVKTGPSSLSATPRMGAMKSTNQPLHSTQA